MAPIEIATASWYNFFYLAAVAAAAGVMNAAGRRNGWDPTMWRFAIIAWVAGGVIGALVPRLVLGDLAAARTCLGAIAGAVVALVLTARSLRIPVTRALDATAVAIPLGGAVVRIGCFLAECCQGTVTTLPIGIALHSGDEARHPVQLYEASLEAALAMVVSRRFSAARQPGDAILFSIGSIAAIRFATEFVRDNEKLGALSLAQWIVLPVALICFAMLVAPRRALLASDRPGRSSPAHYIVGVGALAGSGFALWRHLPPLEAATLILAAGIFAIVIASRFRAAAPTGVAVLALQMPAITSDSTFPRTYNFLGGGFTMGSYDYRHYQSSCDGPHEDWNRHSTFGGASLEVGTRKYTSPTRAIGVRGRSFYGNHQMSRATVVAGSPRNPGPHSVSSFGLSLVGDADWKYFGVSLGGSIGNLVTMSPQSSEDAAEGLGSFGALALRVGKLHGASLEARVGDEVPSWAPAPVATLALGIGDRRGNRIRAGISEVGIFVGGRHLTPGGFEVMPSVGIGQGSTGDVKNALQGGVMVRKWSRADNRP